MRLPYELRDAGGDRRSLRQLSHDELTELWETCGFEPARELLADQIVYDYEHMTAWRDFNLKTNLAYMFAMAQGLPEWAARKLAQVHPETLIDLVQPLSAPAELAYALTAKDLVDAVRDDVWSWRTLGEVAMILPYGRVGKIGKIDDAIDAMDDLRDAGRAADDLRDVKRAADEIEDTRSVVKIGGPSEFDPKSLHGMSGDDVRASIPADWEVKPTRSGGGTIFKDPTHHGRQIRIMPGYPAGSRPDPVTTGPYAVVSQNGEPVKIPLAGNPTLGQP